MLIPDPSGGFGYETDNAILLDERGVQFFVGTYYPKVLNEHAATMYLGAFADNQGARLNPARPIDCTCPPTRPSHSSGR